MPAGNYQRPIRRDSELGLSTAPSIHEHLFDDKSVGRTSVCSWTSPAFDRKRPSVVENGASPLGDGVDEDDRGELLVVRDAAGDPRLDLVGVDVTMSDDVGDGPLPGALVGGPYDGRIGDVRMGQQEGLELCRRDLKPLDLDQLLEAIGDVQLAVVVEMAEIAGVDPALWVDRLGGRLRVVEIAGEDLRPRNHSSPVEPAGWDSPLNGSTITASVLGISTPDEPRRAPMPKRG
jgi:hypothetical protein